jgi:hypothetical protein
MVVVHVLLPLLLLLPAAPSCLGQVADDGQHWRDHRPGRVQPLRGEQQQQQHQQQQLAIIIKPMNSMQCCDDMKQCSWHAAGMQISSSGQWCGDRYLLRVELGSAVEQLRGWSIR